MNMNLKEGKEADQYRMSPRKHFIVIMRFLLYCCVLSYESVQNKTKKSKITLIAHDVFSTKG